MTACGMKYNPLIDISKNSNFNELTDTDLSSFFFHYYQDSDVDLICNKISIIDFIDVVSAFIKKSKDIYGQITVDNVHTGTMILSDDFIIKELEEIGKFLKNNVDIDYIKSNYSNQEIKNYFYDKFYIPWKNEQYKMLKQNGKDQEELFIEYLKPVAREEFRLYNLDYESFEEKLNKQDYEKYFYLNKLNKSNEPNKLIGKLSESIRFKVKSKESKTFEIFKSHNENFFSVVSRFHMGFVRAIWNGKTTLCLPSYITSMMLQLAVDYKYFSSIRDPVEIINKYRSRGFGIILNDFEKLHMAYYNSVKNKKYDSNLKWIEMYKVNLKNKSSIHNIFGVKKSSDDIFKPSKFFLGLPEDCFKNINHDTLSTFNDCFNPIINPILSHIARYKAINDKGYINPLSKDVIYMAWNVINNQEYQNIVIK